MGISFNLKKLNMSIYDLLQKFIDKPSYLKKGKDVLSKIFGVSVSDIEKARILYNTKKAALKVYNESVDYFSNNETVINISSDKPLSPLEIDKLAKVDKLTSFVSNYWIKSKSEGKWTYSVQIKKIIADFYSSEELNQRLQILIPELKPFKIKEIKNKGVETLIIYISDIHAGARNSELNIHNLSYSEEDLKNRLEKIVNEVMSLNKKFKEVVIANLGDSVDGWDGFTQRKTHHLGSMSNKDQFDIYFRSMSIFYKSLFESNISDKFTVINCLDSNHEGVQFSYICNKTVEYFLKEKYPDVKFFQQEKFIELYTFANKDIAMCHGKDATIMKYPMKKHLDDRLDLWANQYFDSKKSKNSRILVKGDLHMFAQEPGKFGTYINIPSVYGTSDYISMNYGISRPGAGIQIIDPDKEHTIVYQLFLD